MTSWSKKALSGSPKNFIRRIYSYSIRILILKEKSNFKQRLFAPLYLSPTLSYSFLNLSRCSLENGKMKVALLFQHK
jgi:hypothetical protein